MDAKRKDIIDILKNAFYTKVEHVYVIGSFLNKNWCPEKSDIDMIIIDNSFDNYHSIYNKKYMNSLVKDISYKIDMFLYSPNEFKMKYKSDKIFRNNIKRGLILF
jgi:predicted nucleotidyltransferase